MDVATQIIIALGSAQVPSNALTLNGVPLMLNGQYLTLGA